MDWVGRRSTPCPIPVIHIASATQHRTEAGFANGNPPVRCMSRRQQAARERIRDPTGKSPRQFIDPSVQPPLQKYSDFPKTQITCITFPVLSHRGAARDRHGRGTGCGGRRRRLRRERLTCGRQNRVVLTPRRWRQVRGKQFPRVTVTKKPDRRGEYDISRKPLRGECRTFPV